jgi:hypothetical protein
MTIATLLRYLVGDRRAILTIAGSRWSILLGLVFVLSAGFAREYDGEDLVSEPWHVVIPLGVSLVSSFALFTLAFLPRLFWPRDFAAGHLAFLGLFWMTAPLAWLYAIPYERFMDAVGAMTMNLLTLAVVSVWRVALMTRVLTVLLGYPWPAAFCIVMLFADVTALVAASTVPVPLLALMGGVRMSAAERVLSGTAMNVFCFGGLTLPVWFFGSLAVYSQYAPRWPTESLGHARPSTPLWLLTAASLAVWPFVLPLTQPEQQRRQHVETAFAEGRISEALEIMSEHDASAFPPHWEPPPRHMAMWVDGESHPLLETWQLLIDRPVAPWVRAAYLAKLHRLLRDGRLVNDGPERMARLLVRLPEADGVIAAVESEAGADHLQELKVRLKQLREVAPR